MRYRNAQSADEIRIYKGRYIQKVGSPAVVFAVGRDGDYLIGEYYILFGDEESSVVAERLRVRSMEVAGAESRLNLNIDTAFLLDSMREQAESQINDRAFEVMKSNSEMAAAWNWLVLNEGSTKDLLNIFLRGNYSGFIRQAAGQSQFVELSQLFDRFDALGNIILERIPIRTDENA